MSPNDIPDVDLPEEVQEDIEDRVRQILTMFFIDISKIAEDESLSHTELAMLCKSQVSGAKQGLTEVVDTALSTVFPVNQYDKVRTKYTYPDDDRLCLIISLAAIAERR